MAITFRESTPAEIRSSKRFMALHELCLRADTPGSLRVISHSLGIDQHFRGKNAPGKAAELAHRLHEDRAGEWQIQTGRGWTVATAQQFGRREKLAWEFSNAALQSAQNPIDRSL